MSSAKSSATADGFAPSVAFVLNGELERANVAPHEKVVGIEEHHKWSTGRNSSRPDEAEARFRARDLALRITKEERTKLFAEHAQLAMKEIAGTLSSSERIKLSKTRWHIDRIQDAEVGPSLDVLERMVQEQRNVAMRIDQFAKAVREAAKKTR